MSLTKASREINSKWARLGGVAADARGAINTETANLLAGVSDDDDEDPFAGLEEDEDELEENETVLDDC